MNLTETIYATMESPVSNDLVKDLTIPVLKYLLKMINYAQFRRAMPQLKAAQQRALYERATCDFDVVVKAKLATIAYVRGASVWRASRIYRVDDPLMFQTLEELPDSDVDAMESATRLVFHDPGDPPDLRHPLPTLAEHDRECAECLATVWPHVKRFVSKRMWFVCTSNNMLRSDLEHDLLEHAVRTFYLNRPFRSLPHVLNSMRQSTSNFGLNRIAYYQATKRRRLSDEKDGPVHENTIISMYRTTQGGDLSESTGVIPEVEKAYADVTPREIEAECLLSELRRCFRERDQPLKQQAVDLLLGKHDDRFVEFVGKRHKRFAGVTTVTECRERMTTPVFFSTVRDYLGVTPESFDRFTGSLRRQLAYA